MARTVVFESGEDFLKHLQRAVPDKKRKAQAVFYGDTPGGMYVETKIGGEVFQFQTTNGEAYEDILGKLRRLPYGCYAATIASE